MQRRSFIAGLAAIGWLRATPAFAQTDPLPSWNEGPVKRAILDFVPKVTTAGNRDFVPMAERIACFDNDGTLWTEQPNYIQALFALDRVKALASHHPDWKTLEPFKWALEDNRDAQGASGSRRDAAKTAGGRLLMATSGLVAPMQFSPGCRIRPASLDLRRGLLSKRSNLSRVQNSRVNDLDCEPVFKLLDLRAPNQFATLAALTDDLLGIRQNPRSITRNCF